MEAKPFDVGGDLRRFFVEEWSPDENIGLLLGYVAHFDNRVQVSPFCHASSAMQPAAAEEMQQDGFRLVLLMMCRGNYPSPEIVRNLEQQSITLSAGRLLKSDTGVSIAKPA